MLHSEMAIFASRQGLTAAEAVVLPALFDRAATETGRTVRGLVSTATYGNPAVGEYLASVARQVAQEAA